MLGVHLAKSAKTDPAVLKNGSGLKFQVSNGSKFLLAIRIRGTYRNQCRKNHDRFHYCERYPHQKPERSESTKGNNRFDKSGFCPTNKNYLVFFGRLCFLGSIGLVAGVSPNIVLRTSLNRRGCSAPSQRSAISGAICIGLESGVEATLQL